MIDETKLQAFIDLTNSRNAKHFEWVKHILLLASGLLGVLVSLHSTKSTDHCLHYSFVATVSTLGAGILCGSIHLYAEINGMNRLQSKMIEKLKAEMKGTKDLTQTLNGQPSFIFTIIEWICYVSFLLSIISLVTYAILSDI